MKITNLDKAETYQLYEDTKIEIERTNPFFNDYGEQSVPLDIPASEHNRQLLGYPDIFGRREKMQTADVSIQDGEYHAQCRQFVLSATRRGAISTSFYINDGSFYSRIQNVKLKDIFADDIIQFTGDTVNQRIQSAIQFCRSLRDGTDNRFAIFPVLVDDDSGVGKGLNYKIINAFGRDTVKRFYVRGDSGQWGGAEEVPYEDVTIFTPDDTGTGCDFYNATDRTEYVNEIPVSLAPGYYISPFVRANYVLAQIFRHFGYSLLPNFFTDTPPFNDMVLLNNVIDTLANGRLAVADLLPDVTVADFLAVFRRKFCCEFTSDEEKRTAGIVFLRDVVDGAPVTDLTKCLTAEPLIQYKSEKDFKRVIIASKETLDSDADGAYDDIRNLALNNPAAYLDVFTGAFYKEGFSGNYRVNTKIADASMPYNTGEDTEEQKVEVPDCIPEFRQLSYQGTYEGFDYEQKIGTWLYVGPYTTINSKMTITGDDDTENTQNSPNHQTTNSPNHQKTMLAFAYMSQNTKPAGTISPYDIQAPSPHTGGGYPKIFDYALYYYGTEGIFERFWRHADTLYRNALQETKMRLLLSQSLKQNLPAWAKVAVRGVNFFLNKLKFTLGGKDEPVESELLSLAMTTPMVEAGHITDMLPRMTAQYKWVGHITEEEVSKSQYENAGNDKERTFTVVYPPVPSLMWVGVEYAKQTSYTRQRTQHPTFFRHSKYKYTKTTVWLTVESANTSSQWAGPR